jgi:hypothetical protein
MLALASYSASLFGEEPKKESPGTAVPSKAFLEYIAELQEIKGELISPIDMLEIDSNIVAHDKENLAAKPKDKKLELRQDIQLTNNKNIQSTELQKEKKQ